MRRLKIDLAALLLVPIALTAAQPVPAGAQSAGPFMVFFERDSTVLTPAGRATLDIAAEAFQAGDRTRTVMVDGHTDLAVEAEAAVRETQIRANNVRDYLVSRGVPANVIHTEAFGNTRPLVDTAPGVAEPQNRRVEITFGPGGGW